MSKRYTENFHKFLRCSTENYFRTANKRKSTGNKIMGYLLRVLFFNAFELGAVICKDAHVGAI
jgi:hypothetical protein